MLSRKVISLVMFDMKGSYNQVYKERLLQRLTARGNQRPSSNHGIKTAQSVVTIDCEATDTAAPVVDYASSIWMLRCNGPSLALVTYES